MESTSANISCPYSRRRWRRRLSLAKKEKAFDRDGGTSTRGTHTSTATASVADVHVQARPAPSCEMFGTRLGSGEGIQLKERTRESSKKWIPDRCRCCCRSGSGRRRTSFFYFRQTSAPANSVNPASAATPQERAFRACGNRKPRSACFFAVRLPARPRLPGTQPPPSRGNAEHKIRRGEQTGHPERKREGRTHRTVCAFAERTIPRSQRAFEAGAF